MCSSVTRRDSVILLVRSLERGGAERQVVVLAKALRGLGSAVKVITFYDGGALRAELMQSGVPVLSLGKSSRWDVVPFMMRLVRVLKRERPTVLHSFLTVPNVVAAAIKPWLQGVRVVWGVRASNMDMTRYDWLASATDRLEGRLAHRADLIIFNSHAGLQHAMSRGFPGQKAVVIPNGIDTQRFYPDAAAGAALRAKWGLTDRHITVGLVARFDPMKDHENFLRAAKIVAEQCPAARFACIGDGPAEQRDRIRVLATELGISERVIWAGVLDDMRSANCALDIACSASRYGEGFSNSIAEAMACGITCVATDVGDSARLIGDTGKVVSPASPAQLANAIMQLIALGAEGRAAQGVRARTRIESEFSVECLVRGTTKALALVG
jgi:glycosyltransferase involved in cell wall biosynthesis